MPLTLRHTYTFVWFMIISQSQSILKFQVMRLFSGRLGTPHRPQGNSFQPQHHADRWVTALSHNTTLSSGWQLFVSDYAAAQP